MSSPPAPTSPDLSLADQGTVQYTEVRFEFEDFLESVEETLPEGLESKDYNLIAALKDPIKHFWQIPRAMINLPVNAFLFQPFRTLMKIYSFPFLASIPLIIASSIASNKIAPDALGIAIVFSIMMYIGYIAGPIYLKNQYSAFSSIIESNSAPWLTNRILDDFENTYINRWPKNVFVVSLIIPIFLDVQIIVAELVSATSTPQLLITISLVLIGHSGMSIVVFFNLMALFFLRKNSSMYLKLLVTIAERVEGYTEGHESLLTQKTFEVVKVLANTPGLSFQNLGNIPTLAFFTGLLVVSSFIFLLGGPGLLNFISDFASRRGAEQMAYDLRLDPSTTLATLKEHEGEAILRAKQNMVTLIFVAAMFLSLVLSFTQVLYPMGAITSSLAKFKSKALQELDPYLYADLTNFALEKGDDQQISTTTVMLSMLRTYVYTMTTSPVSPFKVLYFSTLFLIYSTRVVPFLVTLLS